MKTLALVLVIGVALTGVAPAGAAVKNPTVVQTYRLMSRCANQSGAFTVNGTSTGGEMTYASIFVDPESPSSLGGTIDWDYAIGARGRVSGILIVETGSVPWHELRSCLRSRFRFSSRIL